MPLPVSLNTVPVRAKYVDLSGVAVKGSVTFTATAPALIDDAEDTIIIDVPITVQLVQGIFNIPLPATDDPDVVPTNFTYKVEEKFVGVTGRTYYIQVPLAALDIGYVDLSEAAPATPSLGDPVPFILDQFADVDVAGNPVNSVLRKEGDGRWRGHVLTAGDIPGTEVVGSDAWLKAWGANPDALIFGTVVRNPQEAVASAPVVWPDGKTGVFTALAYSTSGAVNSYSITYVNGSVTKTVTQPAMTRDTAGAVTARPQLTVA